MQQIVLGDPGAGTAPFPLPSTNTRGPLWIINESPYGLNFYFGGQPYLVPAESMRLIEPQYLETGTVRWEIAYTLSIGNSPLSLVVVEAYECGETPQTLIQSVPRQTNIGNPTNLATQAVQVINDGNAAPTTVVEATPTGAAGSQLKFNNDGSGVFGGGLIAVNAAGDFTAIPAGAVPASGVAAGYSASNLGAGTVPANVIVPTAATLASVVIAFDNGTGQIHSTVNARGIALGYLDGLGNYHQVLQVDPNGNVISIAPLTLPTGIQETNPVGYGFTATAAGQLFLAYVNFRQKMTNVPTSITLSGTPTNITGLTADVITVNGFRIHWTSTAAGSSEFNGSYTTVGN